MELSTMKDILIAEAEGNARKILSGNTSQTQLHDDATDLSESELLPRLIAMILLDYPKGDIKHLVEDIIWSESRLEREGERWENMRRGSNDEFKYGEGHA